MTLTTLADVREFDRLKIGRSNAMTFVRHSFENRIWPSPNHCL